jgi:NAD(P)H-dependent flavin oxidoreductase YrpB (nitropropane dioxygenase family)
LRPRWGGATTPEFAAAVSNAGALGQVTATGLDAPTVHARVTRARELTDRPFAVNVILDTWKGHELDAALSAGAPAIFLFWGDPAPHASLVRDAGAKLIVQVGSVPEAEAAVAAGTDVIVAQGFEAGGHVRGTTPLFALLPGVVEVAEAVPVVAAGGVVDGRGLAAALALGASGALMGTRFLASDEINIHPEYQRRIVESDGETVYAEDLFDVAWPSAPHRVLRNRVVTEWERAGRPPLGARDREDAVIGRTMVGDRVAEIRRFTSFTATPAFDGDMEEVSLWAGASVGRVRDVLPVARIVRETVGEAEATLRELSSSVLSAPEGLPAGTR